MDYSRPSRRGVSRNETIEDGAAKAATSPLPQGRE